MERVEQDRWVCEQNVARFQKQLALATSEMDRQSLRAMLAREQDRAKAFAPRD